MKKISEIQGFSRTLGHFQVFFCWIWSIFKAKFGKSWFSRFFQGFSRFRSHPALYTPKSEVTKKFVKFMDYIPNAELSMSVQVSHGRNFSPVLEIKLLGDLLGCAACKSREIFVRWRSKFSEKITENIYDCGVSKTIVCNISKGK